MKLNDLGINIIKEFEQCRLKAYPDPATGGKPWTIGWGSTGQDIGHDTIWTQEQADKRLQDTLDVLSNEITELITKPCNDNQFSAIVSLTYNIGINNFKHSTLLKLVSQGDYPNAANEFLKWDRANGKVMPGLLRRREAERDLFLKPVA